MPRKVFTAGEVLAAADVNEFLMDQAVMTFAGTAARGSAIGTATEGMLTYLEDSDTFEFWDGSAYVPFGVPDAPTLEYLVLGGGGGGGRRDSGSGAGGGGAGGYRNNVSGELSGGSAVAEASLALTLGTYGIVVGAGGAGATGTNLPGNPGTRSLLYLISSQGGGGGCSFSFATNPQGGSGGGAFLNRSLGAPGIVGEGTNGGDGSGSNGGAGGGGAGAKGVNVSSANGSNGGAGLASSITGSSVTRGGGGGGGGQFLGGTGGTGGGGNGDVSGTGGNGTVNTGGGGGGTSTGNGGNGGSGIVVFAVPTTLSVSFTGGVTQTNSTISGKQVYVVTATSTTSETVTFS